MACYTPHAPAPRPQVHCTRPILGGWMVAGAADSSSADPSEVPALLVAATAVRHPTNRIPLVATVALQVGAAVEEVVLLKPPTGARGAAVLDGLERDVWERRQSDGGGGGGPVLPSGRVVGIIACGGNTDFDTFTRMAAYSPSPGGEEGH